MEMTPSAITPAMRAAWDAWRARTATIMMPAELAQRQRDFAAGWNAGYLARTDAERKAR